MKQKRKTMSSTHRHSANVGFFRWLERHLKGFLFVVFVLSIFANVSLLIMIERPTIKNGSQIAHWLTGDKYTLRELDGHNGGRVTGVDWLLAPPPPEEQKDIWPDPAQPWNDRIVSQLRYVSPTAAKIGQWRGSGKAKLILMADGLPGDVREGSSRFVADNCAVQSCFVTDNWKFQEVADLLVLKHPPEEFSYRPWDQIWMWFQIEPQLYTEHDAKGFKGTRALNWTSTFKSDSTIVAPYEKWVQFSNVTQLPKKPHKNFAVGKEKKVAMFVSNCGADNRRLEYATELALYIDVDIYGACGNLTCDRFNGRCNYLLRDHYKFYLSFENSNCHNYISEKFFVNALWNDVVPVVMGARPEDYEAVAPPHSYIHVESFPSAKELAAYLHLLDKNDDLYNSYFRWKGTGEFINTFWWCRVCAMLHYDGQEHKHTWYEDLNEYWAYNTSCVHDRWS